MPKKMFFALKIHLKNQWCNNTTATNIWNWN